MDSEKVIESLRAEFKAYEKSKQASDQMSNKILRRVTIALCLLAFLILFVIGAGVYWYNYNIKRQVYENFNAVLENQKTLVENHRLDSITLHRFDSFMNAKKNDNDYKKFMDSLFNLK